MKERKKLVEHEKQIDEGDTFMVVLAVSFFLCMSFEIPARYFCWGFITKSFDFY